MGKTKSALEIQNVCQQAGSIVKRPEDLCFQSGNPYLGNICGTASLQMLFPTYQAWNQNRENELLKPGH